MFNIGDYVVYGSQGVCKIDSIQIKQIGKAAQDYYVLKPISSENTVVFVPVDNEVLTAKMQKILTKTQAQEIIDSAPNAELIVCMNEADKREQYKTALASGDRKLLLGVIKTIRAERDVRRVEGKKLNLVDEQTLRKAELILFNELAFVLEDTLDNICDMIKF